MAECLSIQYSLLVTSMFAWVCDRGEAVLCAQQVDLNGWRLIYFVLHCFKRSLKPSVITLHLGFTLTFLELFRCCTDLSSRHHCTSQFHNLGYLRMSCI